MAYIRRGDPCRLRYTVTNGMDISELGTPTAAFVQNLSTVLVDSSKITVDSDTNSVVIELSGEETTPLVDGFECRFQIAFSKDSENILRFPIEYVDILEPALGVF